MLVDIDIIMRVFMKILLGLISVKWTYLCIIVD